MVPRSDFQAAEVELHSVALAHFVLDGFTALYFASQCVSVLHLSEIVRSAISQEHPTELRVKCLLDLCVGFAWNHHELKVSSVWSSFSSVASFMVDQYLKSISGMQITNKKD